MSFELIASLSLNIGIHVIDPTIFSVNFINFFDIAMSICIA
ncbi:hypothetical protein GPSY_2985 [Paraglaciecola psychrophila 170]|nr:hypothetical protein GPSY_2985 [Paraglaciecola psychrophila 170]